MMEALLGAMDHAADLQVAHKVGLYVVMSLLIAWFIVIHLLTHFVVLFPPHIINSPRRL
jgi:hypothetical protein